MGERSEWVENTGMEGEKREERKRSSVLKGLTILKFYSSDQDFKIFYAIFT